MGRELDGERERERERKKREPPGAYEVIVIDVYNHDKDNGPLVMGAAWDGVPQGITSCNKNVVLAITGQGELPSLKVVIYL